MIAFGKFDLNDSEQPYSGIAAAYGEICREIRNARTVKRKEGQNGTKLSDFEDMMSSYIGSELTQHLARLIPDLHLILPALEASQTEERTHDSAA